MFDKKFKFEDVFMVDVGFFFKKIVIILGFEFLGFFIVYSVELKVLREFFVV